MNGKKPIIPNDWFSQKSFFTDYVRLSARSGKSQYFPADIHLHLISQTKPGCPWRELEKKFPPLPIPPPQLLSSELALGQWTGIRWPDSENMKPPFFIWHHFHQQVDNSWPHGWTRPWWTERCLHHSQLPILIIPAWPPGWDLLLMMMIHLLDSVGSIGNVCRWDSQPSCKTCPLTSRFFHLDFPSLKFPI